MKNKILLLNKYPKHKKILSLIILLPLTITLFFVETYDSYNVVGLYTCENECSITFVLPYTKGDILDDNFKLEYNNKEYEVKDITIDEPYLENNVAYEDITIKSDLVSNNKVINLKLIYNKQRIIKKIFDAIKG